MTWADAMAAGNAALAAGDPAVAYAEFGKAHDLGHEVRREHFAAHRGMIRAAWQRHRYDQIATNLLLLMAAFIFDWPRQRATA